MKFECTCRELSKEQYENLTRDARPTDGARLRKEIKEHLPELYDRLVLDYPNPYESQSKETDTHYIYVHSMIEYFIQK